MKTKQQTHLLTLIIAMFIGIAFTSVVSTITTKYAKVICQTIEDNEYQEQQKMLFSPISTLNIQTTANNGKLPTITAKSLTKRTTQPSTLNSQLQTANTIILNSLRENSCSNILSYSHRPPLYYIFALHRMRN